MEENWMGSFMRRKRINPSITRPSFLDQKIHPALSSLVMKIDAVLHIHFKGKMEEENK